MVCITKNVKYREAPQKKEGMHDQCRVRQGHTLSSDGWKRGKPEGRLESESRISISVLNQHPLRAKLVWVRLPGFPVFVRQVTHHLPEGTAPHCLRPPPPARSDEYPPLDPSSD